MFLVYINDIVDGKNGKIKLFADDTALYVDVENRAEAENILSQDLKTLEKWSKKWILQFNATKTVKMRLSLKKASELPSLNLCGKELASVETYKHLGLTFNTKLTFKDHINEIAIKANRKIDVMKRLKYSVDRKTLEVLYISFVRPVLEYANVIWDNCDKNDKQLLENTQLNAARVVTGAIRGTSHKEIYKETGWQLLSDRRECQQLLLFHKMVHGLTPQYLQDLVPIRVGKITNYPVRNRNNLYQIHCRIEIYKNYFLPKMIRKWNSLPLDVRSIENHVHFKRKLFKNGPKANPLFYMGNRKMNIIHARMRMKCSILKGHLYNLHVVDSPNCECGLGEEDVEHYIFHCPLYVRSRDVLFHNLRQVVNMNDITVDRLLYGGTDSIETDKILLESLHSYIKNSGRFDNM